MGLLWFVGLAAGWWAVGLLGVSKIVCDATSGGLLKKYTGVARSYKAESVKRFG